MKKFNSFAAAAVLIGTVLAASGCGSTDPYKNIVNLDLENSSDYIFEAEEAELHGKALRPSSKVVKEDFDLYKGDGHVVENEKASGGKHVAYMGANKNDYIKWEIESEAACYANLTFSISTNLRLYYFLCWRDVDTGIFLNGEQIFLDAQDHEKTVDAVALAFNEVLTYENVKLKKGTNEIKMVALADEEVEFWHVDRRPKANDIWGKKASKMPKVDYMKITASVGETNFTFKNKKTDNELNTNGNNTLNNADWFNGYILTDADYASYDSWADNL